MMSKKVARGEASWQPRVRGLPLVSALIEKGEFYELNVKGLGVLWETAGS